MTAGTSPPRMPSVQAITRCRDCVVCSASFLADRVGRFPVPRDDSVPLIDHLSAPRSRSRSRAPVPCCSRSEPPPWSVYRSSQYFSIASSPLHCDVCGGRAAKTCGTHHTRQNVDERPISRRRTWKQQLFGHPTTTSCRSWRQTRNVRLDEMVPATSTADFDDVHGEFFGGRVE